MKKLFLLLSVYALTILLGCTPDGSKNILPPPGGDDLELPEDPELPEDKSNPMPKIVLRTQSASLQEVFSFQLDINKVKNISLEDISTISLGYLFIPFDKSDETKMIDAKLRLDEVYDPRSLPVFYMAGKDFFWLEQNEEYELNFRITNNPTIESRLLGLNSLYRDNNQSSWEKLSVRDNFMGYTEILLGSDFAIKAGKPVFLLILQRIVTVDGKHIISAVNLDSMNRLMYFVGE